MFSQDVPLGKEGPNQHSVGSHLLVLLRLLPAPSPPQRFPLHSLVHQGVEGLPEHEIPVVEAPHTCSEKERSGRSGGAGVTP